MFGRLAYLAVPDRRVNHERGGSQTAGGDRQEAQTHAEQGQRAGPDGRRGTHGGGAEPAEPVSGRAARVFTGRRAPQPRQHK